MSLDIFDADGKFPLSGIETKGKWLNNFNLNWELIIFLCLISTFILLFLLLLIIPLT